MSFYIHPSAEVSAEAIIGAGTRIWHQAQVRQGAQIGSECIIGKGVYIDFDVVIGNRCKLQNGVYVYHGATLEDGVFLGPGVMLLNDKNPRAINPDGALKSDADWQVSPTYIGYGAGVGGGAVILPGVSVGKWAIIGSGAVVTRNIPAYGLAYGNPARLAGFVCPCGQRLLPAATQPEDQENIRLFCSHCQQEVTIPEAVFHQAR
ncbi:MAG: N-acetyltransferase [Anaerolineales bacterium]|nr:N-acetyltransferase [Anaerolineales bacterium]